MYGRKGILFLISTNASKRTHGVLVMSAPLQWNFGSFSRGVMRPQTFPQSSYPYITRKMSPFFTTFVIMKICTRKLRNEFSRIAV